jgi:hypothetical protein
MRSSASTGAAARPRILFLTCPHEDYLADGLLHGLRSVLGADVVDYPKADYLYQSYPAERRESLYGRGFTLYCLLEDIDVDRHRPLQRAQAGEFDLIVFADIWSSFGRFVELAPRIAGTQMVVLDGADREEPYPYAGEWWRRRVWWMLPRAHTRARYFKRELTPRTGWFRSYLSLPPALASRLPSVRAMREISFSIPAEKLVGAASAEKRALLASHVVDPEVAERTGAGSSYVFARESDYYADLQGARFGVTVKRAGWDCLRHYELAANGCVPCFRELERKPERCAPHGLGEGNCVSYTDYDDLVRRLNGIGDERYRSLRRGALEWAAANTTFRRAQAFLAACGWPGVSAAGMAAPEHTIGSRS